MELIKGYEYEYIMTAAVLQIKAIFEFCKSDNNKWFYGTFPKFTSDLLVHPNF